MSVDITEIRINDLEDVRDVLGACLMFFHARDLQEAQVAYTNPRPSPLTLDIERVKARFDGYMSDFLLHRYEESQEVDLSNEEAENGSQEASEASEEVLPDAPLGGLKRQSRGRRLTADELKQDNEDD